MCYDSMRSGEYDERPDDQVLAEEMTDRIVRAIESLEAGQVISVPKAPSLFLIEFFLFLILLAVTL